MSISANKLFQSFKKSEEKSQFINAAEPSSAHLANAEADKVETQAQVVTNEAKKHSCCGGCGGGH
jgi:hypothetical protein